MSGGGGQGMQTGGGQFGGLPLGNGGQGSIPQRTPMMGGMPGQRPPMMGPGGPGGFREGPYPMPGGMTGGPDPMRNPMLGGVKSPMGPQGQLPEDYLRMMQQQQQRGLLDQTRMPQVGMPPPGVGIGMDPQRMPPQQGGNEMAQIMSQYMPR